MFYSYKARSSNIHHLVKANFTQTNESSYSLNEVYHQTIPGDSTDGSISKMSVDNQTLWHAVNLNHYVTYFQYNLTDFSLIGFSYRLSYTISRYGLEMEVSQEIV